MAIWRTLQPPRSVVSRRSILSIRLEVVRIGIGTPATCRLLNKVVTRMNEVRTLLTGRGLVESPRWHGDRLYFSDWSAGEVIAVDLAKPGWNDIVVDGRGNAYVNRLGFDMMAGEEPKPGFVALVTADGSVRQVADEILFPNGMAVTSDNSTLIVADSYGHNLVAFDIDTYGDLSNRRVWADLGEGTPDGICLDAQQAVWYADVPNRRCVRVAEGGTVLQTVELDRGCFACALGGPDGTTLFIVAAEWRGMSEMVPPGTGQVLATQVEVPGAGWP